MSKAALDFKAQIVLDSMAPSGVRLTTMLCTYPGMVHQDIQTHRTVSQNMTVDSETLQEDVSRSTNSNRAMPSRATLSQVWRSPFCPRRFPKRARSMHSSQGYHSGWKHHLHRQLWLKSRYVALLVVLLMQWAGCHKQIANRLLQPWQWVTVVMTACDTWWLHFFSLRHHYMAQDEVQILAELAHNAYDTSGPQQLKNGQWHLPFVAHEDMPLTERIKLSVARCARTSYAPDGIDVLTFRTYGEDTKLHDSLVTQTPEHAGPREHQAMAVMNAEHRSGNLHGWSQLRHSQVGRMMARRASDTQKEALAPFEGLAKAIRAGTSLSEMHRGIR